MVKTWSFTASPLQQSPLQSTADVPGAGGLAEAWAIARDWWPEGTCRYAEKWDVLTQAQARVEVQKCKNLFGRKSSGGELPQDLRLAVGTCLAYLACLFPCHWNAQKLEATGLADAKLLVSARS